MHIQPHSQACNLEGEGRPPLSFLKIVGNVGKKGPDCVRHWVKFSIQNIVLRVYRRESSKLFPRGAFFSCVFDEMLIEVP